jgi:hypothetical protein
MLSENECPNSGLDSVFGSDCSTGALTFFGYCGTCWTFPESRVPSEWVARVDALLVARHEEVRS